MMSIRPWGLMALALPSACGAPSTPTPDATEQLEALRATVDELTDRVEQLEASSPLPEGVKRGDVLFEVDCSDGLRHEVPEQIPARRPDYKPFAPAGVWWRSEDAGEQWAMLPIVDQPSVIDCRPDLGSFGSSAPNYRYLLVAL